MVWELQVSVSLFVKWLISLSVSWRLEVQDPGTSRLLVRAFCLVESEMSLIPLGTIALGLGFHCGFREHKCSDYSVTYTR